MKLDNLVENMCYKVRDDFDLLPDTQQESIKNEVKEFFQSNFKDYFLKKSCSNCRYYTSNPKIMGGRLVCSEIDDSYTEHFAGFFMPPETFKCSEWRDR